MKPGILLKISVDAVMTLALFFVSGYQLWGEAAHEWAGAALFILFILHHVLNLGWFRTIFQGRYPPVRIVSLSVTALLLLVMLIQMYSGILLSQHVFAGLGLRGNLAVARQLHILGAYWGVLLVGLHLGLHWQMLRCLLERRLPMLKRTPIAGLCRAAVLALAVWGAWAFVQRDFPACLFLRTEFVFLDFDEPAAAFYADYFAIITLCACLGYYADKLCRRPCGRMQQSQ